MLWDGEIDSDARFDHYQVTSYLSEWPPADLLKRFYCPLAGDVGKSAHWALD